MSFYDAQESSSSASGPQRKTWDNDEYEERANERMKKEQEDEDIKEGRKKKPDAKIKREMLQAREYKLDLESKVGKSVVINKATPSSETGGFYCDVCDCVMKDSINFLDHVNGKNHQRNMGMSMKVKKSSVDDVRARFAFKKLERERLKKEERVEAMLEDVQQEEARIKDSKKDKKPENRKRKAEPTEAADLDEDIQNMMGFGGFGSSKK